MRGSSTKIATASYSRSSCASNAALGELCGRADRVGLDTRVETVDTATKLQWRTSPPNCAVSRYRFSSTMPGLLA